MALLNIKGKLLQTLANYFSTIASDISGNHVIV